MKIKTTRNVVITEPPEPNDAFFFVSLLGPGDGDDLFNPRSIKLRNLPLRPITEYQEWLDWAVSIADQFERPIYVVPMTVTAFLHRCEKVLKS